jgi:hypothetical protein
MNMRRVFIVSLCLNLALTGVIFSRLKSPRASSSSEMEMVTNTIASVRVVESKAAKINPASLPEFHWRMIETNDYRAYIANLRGIGCPEKTIQDIIIADIEKRFDVREKELPLNEKFWQTATQRDAANRQRQRQERELEEEKRALIQDLLGVDWDAEVHELWREEKDAELVLGFLAEPRAMQLLEAFVRAGNRASAIREEARGILIPEDEEKLKQIGEDLRRQFNQWLSPVELEEFFVRTQAIMERDQSENLVGVDLTGDEYRELMKLKAKGTDLFEKMLQDLNFGPEGHDQAAEEQFAVGARSLLGDTRFAALERAQDSRFQQAYQTAKEFDLPVEAAIKVYELRQAAEKKGRAVAHRCVASERATAGSLEGDWR